MMHLHHDAPMRTTIDLPPDLHAIAASLARHSGRSLSQTVADLLRRALGMDGVDAPSRVAEPRSRFRISPVTGLPTVRSPRPVTPEDVKALEDEP
jgi:hypothetical protein